MKHANVKKLSNVIILLHFNRNIIKHIQFKVFDNELFNSYIISKKIINPNIYNNYLKQTFLRGENNDKSTLLK